MIDPAEHVGIAIMEAKAAAKRDGCALGEYMGLAYIALADAAKRYDPGKGTFATYARKYIKWRFVDERTSRNVGYDTSKMGGSGRGGMVKLRNLNDDAWEGIGVADQAESPLAALIRREEEAAQHRRVTENQVDPDFAYVLARGITGRKTLASMEGVSQASIYEWMNHLKYEHGVVVKASFRPRKQGKYARRKKEAA